MIIFNAIFRVVDWEAASQIVKRKDRGVNGWRDAPLAPRALRVEGENDGDALIFGGGLVIFP